MALLATAHQMDKLTFPSKIDGWLLVLLVGSSLACLLAAGVLVVSATPFEWFIAGVLTNFGCALPIWLLTSTDYTLTTDTLDIRSGPFRWRVPLADIGQITPTRNSLSSPALSLRRLRIDYGTQRCIMISPLEEERFLRELEARRARLVKPTLPPNGVSSAPNTALHALTQIRRHGWLDCKPTLPRGPTLVQQHAQTVNCRVAPSACCRQIRRL